MSIVDKPWGHELIWALSEIYCGKVLFVKAGASLSLQFHREKDELTNALVEIFSREEIRLAA